MHDVEFFKKWQASLLDNLTTAGILPKEVPGKEAVVASCETAKAAWIEFDEARKQLTEINKKPPKDRGENEVQTATEAMKEAKKRFDDIMAAGDAVAEPILQEIESSGVLSQEFDDSDLVILIALMSTNPKKLATYCEEAGEEKAEKLLQVLGDPALVKLWLSAGGPCNAEYGPASHIHFQLLKKVPRHKENPVLSRLATAVTLAFAGPLDIYPCNQDKVDLDPVDRYLHYEKAYKDGELDPAFPFFTIWEMRLIVNSDAPNDHLAQGRAMLRNYRPDLVLLENEPIWRYTFVVRSDVAYKAPVWHKGKPSYDQILSGGGQCGPRAWYGRFIPKAFGIPTWGVRQPGHAAVGRWSTRGWGCVLGEEFDVSNWDGRLGDEFLLEANAREALITDPNDMTPYVHKVMRLEWIGIAQGGNNLTIRAKLYPDPAFPWNALSQHQRRLVVSKNPREKAEKEFPYTGNTMIEKLMNEPETCEALNLRPNRNIITIPAALCSKPDKSVGGPTSMKKGVYIMKSFLGGKQISIFQQGEVEYIVPPVKFPPNAAKFRLTCKFCTVHQDAKPLIFTIIYKGNESKFPVELPNTEGKWQDMTPPIEFELDGGLAPGVTIKIKREVDLGATTIKHLLITPA